MAREVFYSHPQSKSKSHSVSSCMQTVASDQCSIHKNLSQPTVITNIVILMIKYYRSKVKNVQKHFGALLSDRLQTTLHIVIYLCIYDY